MASDHPLFSLVLTSVVTGGIGLLAGWFFGRKGNISAISKLSRGQIPTQLVSGRMKLVLIVRTDLKMGAGKIAAQCSHATLSCYQEAVEVNPALVAHWEDQGQPKIVLKAESYDELLVLQAKATSMGLVNSIVHDAGHTQVPAGTATVLGIGPGMASEIDRVSGELKLL